MEPPHAKRFTLLQASSIVLCTIHQPSSELFEQFDRILCLREGQILLQGVNDHKRRAEFGGDFDVRQSAVAAAAGVKANGLRERTTAVANRSARELEKLSGGCQTNQAGTSNSAGNCCQGSSTSTGEDLDSSSGAASSSTSSSAESSEHDPVREQEQPFYSSFQAELGKSSRKTCSSASVVGGPSVMGFLVSIGRECPPFYNPADWMLLLAQTLSDGEAAEIVHQTKELHKAGAGGACTSAPLQESPPTMNAPTAQQGGTSTPQRTTPKTPANLIERKRRPFAAQLFALTQREFQNSFRNWKALLIRLGVPIIMALLLSVLFHGQGIDLASLAEQYKGKTPAEVEAGLVGNWAGLLRNDYGAMTAFMLGAMFQNAQPVGDRRRSNTCVKPLGLHAELVGK